MKIKNYEQILEAMRTHYQTEGQTVLEHGLAVSNNYAWLEEYLAYDVPTEQLPFPIPSWISDNKEFIRNHTISDWIMRRYLLNHDCGKPFCETIDENGQRHFPNHAEVSYLIWTAHTEPTSDNRLIGELIRNDMFFHITKLSDEEAIKEMAKRRIAIPLLLSAFCAIHANASMFGGYESASFKIKQKRLNKIAVKLIGEIQTR